MKAAVQMGLQSWAVWRARKLAPPKRPHLACAATTSRGRYFKAFAGGERVCEKFEKTR